MISIRSVAFVSYICLYEIDSMACPVSIEHDPYPCRTPALVMFGRGSVQDPGSMGVDPACTWNTVLVNGLVYA